MEFTPISGACGAEVSGIDLERDLTPERVEALTTGLGEYGVLVFRGQTLSPEDHLAMGEAFGGVNVNRFFKAVDGWPGIAEVRKEPEQKANIGGQWHTDHTYDIEPALGSILVARELPPFGGDTLFSSMYAAYGRPVGRDEGNAFGHEGRAFEPPCLRNERLLPGRRQRSCRPVRQ